MARLFGILVTILFAIAAAVVTWPQFFRLERTLPFAQIISLRGVMVVGFAALGVLFLFLLISRKLRAFAGSMAVLSLLAGAVNAGIMASRGIGSDELPEATESSVRVMTWNTAGAATDPQVIAQTAVAFEADIVALPETTIETGEAVALAMRELERPMWAHHETYADRENYSDWDANSTTLLISPELGDYSVVDSSVNGMSNTTTVPSVVAMPVDGTGPTVVAVHAVAPRADAMENWRTDMEWIADQCGSDNVILAGDFNSTLDHMARLGVDGGTLGRCVDAAAETGNGSVATWSTQWPALVGAPIDRIMATDAWRPTGSVVLSSQDLSGSDHRPVIVQYEPAG